MGERLELTLWDSEHKRLRLFFQHPARAQFPYLNECLISGHFEMTAGTFKVTFDFLCYGWDLDEFKFQLRKMHRGWESQARFSISIISSDLGVEHHPDLDVSLTLTLTGGEEGSVMVGFVVNHLDLGEIHLPRFPGPHRESLRETDEAIERFLRASGVQLGRVS